MSTLNDASTEGSVEQSEAQALMFKMHNGFYTELDVSLIDSSPYQSKIVNQSSEIFIHELADNINEEKLNSPIIVRKKENGRYELIAGEHRLEAFKRNGQTIIPAIIKDLDDLAAAKSAILDNIFRKQNSTLELWRGFKILLDMKAFKTQATLASKVNMSTTEVSRIMACDKLSQDIIDVISKDSHKFGSSTINTFVQYIDEHHDLVLEAAKKIIEEELDQSAALKWLKKASTNNNDVAKKTDDRKPILDANNNRVCTLKVTGKSIEIKSEVKISKELESKLYEFLTAQANEGLMKEESE